MKKVGACIVIHKNNFGSMLQAYATQMFLENQGVAYDVIRYKKKWTITRAIKAAPRLLNRIIWSDKKRRIIKKIGMTFHKETRKLDEVRKKKFAEFREKNFTHLSKVYVGYDQLLNCGKEYDAFLSGSDQLWSPSGLPTNFYNLKFVDENVPKMSYASSFGVPQVPWYQKSRTIDYLNRIENVSVRENSGKKLIKELTGREVPVVVDPTMLFDMNEWSDLIEDKRVYDKPYIFAYFLGPNPEHRRIAEELKKKTKCDILTLRHMDQYIEADESYGDYVPYEVGPIEFVNIIRYADYIVTDSFHGSVFSILHHKKFITFNRYSDKAKDSKNTRIDSLCENLGLSERRYMGNIYEEMIKEIDYSEVDKKLEVLRNESKQYFINALRDSGVIGG